MPQIAANLILSHIQSPEEELPLACLNPNTAFASKIFLNPQSPALTADHFLLFQQAVLALDQTASRSSRSRVIQHSYFFLQQALRKKLIITEDQIAWLRGIGSGLL